MGPLVALLLAVGALVALLLYFFGPRSADAPASTTKPVSSPGPSATPAARTAEKAAPKPAAKAAEKPASKGAPEGAADIPATKRSLPPPPLTEPSAGQAAGLLHVVARTDPGLRRKHNEDSYLVVEDSAVFVVADGMGRHAAGEVASQLTVDVIRGFFADRSGKGQVTGDEPVEGARFREAVLEANRQVFQKATDDEACHGMGTTVVGLVFTPERDRVAILSAGDSRCYLQRGGELRQMTTDHTLGAVGITGGNAGLLSRAVGIEENLEVDLRVEACHPGDLYLLCSDGLSRMVSDEITSTVLGKAAPLEARAAELIDMANQAGGRDNVTVILVQVNERGQV